MLSVYALCLCAQLSLGAGALLCLLFRYWLCSVRAEGFYFPMAWPLVCRHLGNPTCPTAYPVKRLKNIEKSYRSHRSHRVAMWRTLVPQFAKHLQTTFRAADWDRKRIQTQNELQPQPPVHYISAAQQVRTSEQLFELQPWHEALASRR